MLLVAGASALSFSTPGQADPGKKMTFRGRVLELPKDRRDTWFVMNGGGSRKYARVKIVTDKKTRWAGLPGRMQALKLEGPVWVDGVEQDGGDFLATHVEVVDMSKQKPSSVAVKKAGG